MRFIVLALCIGFAACDKETAPASDADSGTCARRSEVHDTHASFDYVEPTDSRAAPQCVPTCGAAMNLDGYPSVAGLPAGSCAKGTQTCDLLAFAPCACSETSGPVNNYRCRCTDGRWHCDNIGAGARACGPCDAGAP